MMNTTSKSKVKAIEFYGGECAFVSNCQEIYTKAQAIAKERNGHFMDQFTYAERATDWRGNNNIAESVFKQMQTERFPIPKWVIIGAGTGGNSATIGRYIRYNNYNTKLLVPDPENSVFFDFFHQKIVIFLSILLLV